MTVRQTSVLLAVAALASLASLAMCVGSAQSAFPGGNGKIVFASDRDGAQDVYVMTADGVSQRRLTNADGDDQYPFWSPDGNAIVFSSARETASSPFGNDKIFRMNADGSAQTRVVDSASHDLEPSWSPTMARIAFRSDRDGGSHIFAMNANGTGVVRLTDVGFDLNPVWSPTADSIAFASDRDGDYEILTMDGNGDNEQPLTNNTAFDSNPDWSPDGSKIAFQSNRDGNFDVWVMNANGGNPVQLTNNPAFDSAPTWSPDGTMLAFQSNRDGDFEIFTMPAGGGVETQLTFNTATDRVADWQPLQAGADTTPPVLTVPGDITTPATSPAGAAVGFLVFANDNLDPSPTVTCAPASGATFPIGTTTVSCTASDGSGNWTDGAFAVTVEPLPPNTPEGMDVTVTPVDAMTGASPVSVRFAEVTVAGDTTLSTSSSGPPPPAGFVIAGVYYELATTAQFDIATICFAYTSPAPTIGHFESGAWVTLATTQDTGSEVCAVVTSFSPFALLQPEPSTGDSDAPVITCDAADGAWHGANVSIACTASDGAGSGLANAGDAAFSITTSVPAGTENANAATGTHQVCDVAGNCGTAGPIGGSKVDRKAPALTLPASKTVNATSPAGAVLSFDASATDGADPSPGVSCMPASGSVFAIGSSTVSCAATDHVGNAANGSFSVTVLGAKEQLARLIQKVVTASSLPPSLKTQLIGKLQALVAGLDPRNTKQKQAVCLALNVFKGAVQGFSGRGIPPAQAAEWIADTNRIRAVLTC